MTSQVIYDTIKRTVLSYLPDSRILLFGSRARGESNIHSDYDLLIILPEILTQKEKLGWSGKIHRAIVKAIHAPVDLLLYSEEEVVIKQTLPGHIVRTAMKEGVAL